jgi:hypothetical protein
MMNQHGIAYEDYRNRGDSRKGRAHAVRIPTHLVHPDFGYNQTQKGQWIPIIRILAALKVMAVHRWWVWLHCPAEFAGKSPGHGESPLWFQIRILSPTSTYTPLANIIIYAWHIDHTTQSMEMPTRPVKVRCWQVCPSRCLTPGPTDIT